MKYKYFTVGPSHAYPKFEEFLAKALDGEWQSVSHRSEQFMQLFTGLSLNLKKFLQIPEDYSVFYAGCATEWMERTVQNCSSQSTLHFVSGVFSKRYWEFSKKIGRDAREVKFREDGRFSLEDAPKGFAPDLVGLTHNETSSGVVLPNGFINDLKAHYPKALFAIDIVSSVPACDLDFKDFDCIFLSVQKGFGLPAGLGVIFVSPKTLEKSKELEQSGQYTGFRHGFFDLQNHYQKRQTPETPNVLNMFLLNEVVKDMAQKGLEIIKKESDEKAEIIFSALKECTETEIVVENFDFRSKTTIVAKTKNGSKPILEKLETKGFIVGAGYGADKDKYIRIANFPSHSREMVKELVGELRKL